MNKMIAEAIGTFALVFFGVGAALFSAPETAYISISFAFGLSVVAMAYGLGPISGAHLNPAVSLGAMLGGRMSTSEMIQYWIAQVAGGILAAIVLMIIGGQVGAASTMPGAEAGVMGALIFEIVATFLFVTVILGSTQNGAPTSIAGLAIGLTLVMIHLTGINISGSSVNPARSIATNIFGGGDTIVALWLYIAGPFAGAALAGILYKAGITRASDDK